MPAPDTLGLRSAALRTPELLAEAVELTGGHGHAGRLPATDRIEAVLLLGAGEGEVAARLVAALAAPLLPVPILCSAGFAAPASTVETTLTMALSCDGEHDECVEACAGLAPGVPVVAICAGGRLARTAAHRGGLVVPLPEGLPVGRTATVPLVGAALAMLESAGLFPGATEWLRLAAVQLARRRDEVTSASDQFGSFGRLGRRLAGTFPLVHGAGPLGGAAAAAWASRVRLDSKGPAWWSTLPGLAHDELAAWGQHGDITRQLVSLVQLRHDHEHPSIAAGFAAADELLAEVVAGIHELRAAGDGAVAQALDLVLQGELTSLAMAAEAGLDPGPVGV